MAETYQIITQYNDVESQGGQRARDVTVVGTLTGGHGVYFERRYPKASFKPSIAKADAQGFTIVFEDLFTIPGVAAVIWGEELNAANQLQDFVDVYYTSTSGESQDFIHELFRRLTHDDVAKRVGAGRAELDALEGA